MRIISGKKLLAAALLALMLIALVCGCALKGSHTEGKPAESYTVSGPLITEQPESVTAADGSTAAFQVTASGSGLSYRWQYSTDSGRSWKDSTMTGHGTPKMEVPVTEARNGYLYHCVVKNSVGSVVSSSAKLTVSGVKPVIRFHTKTVTSAVDMKVLFNVDAAGDGITYRWQYSTDNGKTWNDSTMTGHSTSELEVPVTEARNGYLYRCVVKNSIGSTTTTGARLTVSGVKPAILVHPETVTAAANKAVTFRVTAAGTELKYQWQYSTDDGKTWKNSTMKGYDTPSMKVSVTSARNGYLYRCIAENSIGSTVSAFAKLTVSGVKPAIRVHPEAVTTEANKTVTFRVAAAGTGLKYQWQYSTDNGKTWKDSTMKGYDTPSMKVPVTEARNGYFYRCVVRNSSGSTTTAAAELIVSGVGPVIRVNPTAVASAENKTVTFKVTAAGAELKYQWQYSTDNGKTWKDSTMKGYDTPSMKVQVTAERHGYLYRCVVWNSFGSVTSSRAALTVSGMKPVILAHPQSQKVKCGEDMTMSVSARGGELTYQWQYSLDGGKTWEDWENVTQTMIRLIAKFDLNRSYYRCVVKNAVGSVTSSSAKLVCLSDQGNAYRPYGKTVILSFFVSDSTTSWDFNKKADVDRYWYCLDELKKGVDFLKKAAAKYGRSAEYVYDWSKDSKLSRTAEFNEKLVVSFENRAESYPIQRDFINQNFPAEQILEEYDADNVLYIFNFNTDKKTNTVRPWANWWSGSNGVEIVNNFIGFSGSESIGMVYAHEILHNFGAPDMYYSNDIIPQAYVDHLKAIGSRDIMYNNWGKTVFTDVDAYYVGLKSYASDVQKWGLGKSSHNYAA